MALSSGSVPMMKLTLIFLSRHVVNSGEGVVRACGGCTSSQLDRVLRWGTSMNWEL